MNNSTNQIIQTILITGATDGIGLALARHYQQQAKRLILIGRRPFSDTPLVEFAATGSYCQVDLTQPGCASQVQQWLDQSSIRSINLVIHNAGLGYHGPTGEQSPQSIRDLTAVNLWAPIALTHTLLPYLSPHASRLVFISSVVSALACPDYAVYGATKAALDGYGRNLRLELGPAIPVQIIFPGATRTGLHPKSGLARAQIDWETFPPAETVALKIAAAIERGRPLATIGLTNRLLRIGGRYLGGLFDALQRQHYRRQRT